MQKLLKFILVFIFVLLLLAATFLISYLAIFGGKQMVFLSVNPELKWRINKSALGSIENQMQQEAKEQKPVIVFLSSGFEITDQASGWAEGGIAYSSKWTRFMGKDIFVLFVDTQEWEKIPERARDEVLSIHTISYIAGGLGIPRDKIPDIYSPIFDQTQPVLGLVRK